VQSMGSCTTGHTCPLCCLCSRGSHGHPVLRWGICERSAGSSWKWDGPDMMAGLELAPNPDGLSGTATHGRESRWVRGLPPHPLNADETVGSGASRLIWAVSPVSHSARARPRCSEFGPTWAWRQMPRCHGGQPQRREEPRPIAVRRPLSVTIAVTMLEGEGGLVVRSSDGAPRAMVTRTQTVSTPWLGDTIAGIVPSWNGGFPVNGIFKNRHENCNLVPTSAMGSYGSITRTAGKHASKDVSSWESTGSNAEKTEFCAERRAKTCLLRARGTRLAPAVCPGLPPVGKCCQRNSRQSRVRAEGVPATLRPGCPRQLTVVVQRMPVRASL